MPFGRAFKRTWRLICEVITETTITKLEQWKLLMSVLGQKRTFAVQKGMSAYPQKRALIVTSQLLNCTHLAKYDQGRVAVVHQALFCRCPPPASAFRYESTKKPRAFQRFARVKHNGPEAHQCARDLRTRLLVEKVWRNERRIVRVRSKSRHASRRCRYRAWQVNLDNRDQFKSARIFAKFG